MHWLAEMGWGEKVCSGEEDFVGVCEVEVVGSTTNVCWDSADKLAELDLDLELDLDRDWMFVFGCECIGD